MLDNVWCKVQFECKFVQYVEFSLYTPHVYNRDNSYSHTYSADRKINWIYKIFRYTVLFYDMPMISFVIW